jgi:lipoate-protein ligase A
MRGAANMAIDSALLESARTRRIPTVRFYQWKPACLSFGRNQTTRGLYDVERLRADGIDATRRPTGGLAVLHDRELTYAVAAPADMLGGPRAAYQTINRAIVRGLTSLGVDAALAAGADHGVRPDSDSLNPCFQIPASGEVVVGSVKMVGSAQRCEQRTILQHGSILLGGEQGAIMRYQATAPATGRSAVQTVPEPQAVEAGITLETVLGSVPPMATIVDAMVEAFEVVLGTRLAPGVLEEDEIMEARRLELQYDSDCWIWRR